ncbi:Checkpoint protein Rad17/Rad24 [Penicillium sp. IBT 16267x]|nr:Checkpoint protein Rad17/Rad24 [Penicillium sp. IBT 16267x]
MEGRPPKRQRRSVRGSEHKGDSSNFIRNPVALSSRPKSTRARPSPAPSTRHTSSPSPSPSKPGSSPKTSKSKSLHSFFQPATNGQRWSSQKFEAKRSLASATETLDADEIEDDYDSYDEIFTQHIASQTSGFNPKSSFSSNQGATRASVSKPKPTTARRTNQSTKRFIMPSDSKSHSSQQSDPQPRNQKVDHRPWAQRFAPLNLDELAVHKRKVADVRKSLEDAFAGRGRESLLVLRGPAGSGKTTTISLLSESLDFDILEWKNPAVSEYTAQDYVSVSTQFEEFLGRGDRFGGLDLDDTVEVNDHHNSSSRKQRILLVEEFPTMMSRNSGLAAFRASLQRYLAAAADHKLQEIHPPVVVIVSETLLGSEISDNFTVHRLLGPALFNHPSTKIIDFNSIAPTFMQKALHLILEKEARTSKRARIPGPAVLDKISEIGDVRSAVSSLEFLCLKGDDAGKWGGTLTKTRGKKSRADTAFTPMEEESLKMISQREASLGLFHAVGKILYNKRLDPSLVPDGTTVLPSPPEYLSQHRRLKVSQVAVNALADETGTDITTFVCGLHENYPSSCDGVSFTENLNACIEALSDSDILSTDRRLTQGARGGMETSTALRGVGIDKLRQDEISFQVAARGLLFGLPYPVNRRLASGDGRGRAGDAHKMLYPSSLRLWRKSEEIEGLVDSWMKQMLDPFGNPHLLSHGAGSTESIGVRSWRSLRVGHHVPSSADHFSANTVTMLPRPDAILHQLPYMAQIRHNEPESWQLNQITGIRRSRFDDVDEDELPSPSQPLQHLSSNSNSFGPRLPQEEEKLYLSEDDIVDD